MDTRSTQMGTRQSWKADQRAVQQFNDDGFVIARQLFDTNEMNLLGTIARADRDLANEAYARKDSSGTQTRLALRNELSENCMYSAIVRSNRVAANMATLLNAEPYHYHHKMMLKEPRVGSAWEWHQDYGYWYNFGCLYPDMGSCLLAVDRASRENGCLQVLLRFMRVVEAPILELSIGAMQTPVRVIVFQSRFVLLQHLLLPFRAGVSGSQCLYALGQPFRPFVAVQLVGKRWPLYLLQKVLAHHQAIPSSMGQPACTLLFR